MKNGSEFGKWLSNPPLGEEIVISGISGRFPESNNVREFQENLFNKKDMVTDDDRRWKLRHPQIPHKGGRIFNIDKIDAGYFGLHYRQADAMDPMMRKFLECAVEAILDAGVNPKELEGSRTAVFVGSSFSDSEHIYHTITEPESFLMTGYLRSLIAYRVSYFLKLKGISYIADTACSSSLTALENAFKLIRMGKCDNVIVGGTHLVLHPTTCRNFFRLGMTSPDGVCKVYDENANGYVRSEAVASVFIQKAKNAKRIYVQILNTKINSDGFKLLGITFPSSESQQSLINETLKQAGIDASEISFIEAHSTGTKVGDPEETQAIDEAIAKKRNQILPIGSVKSNVGHTEPSAGLVSLTKVIITMETGLIPPNLHLKKIKKGLLGFEEGRMKVVTEVTPLDRDDAIIGINNFGFGGTNVHVLTQRHKKTKNIELTSDNDVPRLVCVSGRTYEAVSKILEDISDKADYEQIGLLHLIFQQNIAGHIYRGFAVLSKSGPRNQSRKEVRTKCPLHVIFGKFEKKYQVLHQELMQFNYFKKISTKIDNILSGFSNTTKHKVKAYTVFNSFLVQIGLVEIFQLLQLESVSVFGESTGRIVCAYYHKNITLEEAINIMSDLIMTSNVNESIYLKYEKNIENVQLCSNVHNLANTSKKLSKIGRGSLILNVSDSILQGNKVISFGKDNNITFLEILGRLYEEGYNFRLDKLYPPVEYPVGRGTPMISPMIQWNYQTNWCTFKYTESSDTHDFQYEFHLLPHQNDKDKYLLGHVINDRVLVPATKFLELVRKAFIQSLGKSVADDYLPVIYENCKFLKAVAISHEVTTLTVSIQELSGNFEILERDALVVCGRIYSPENIDEHLTDLPTYKINNATTDILEQDDIYNELHLRGYNYSGLFKRIVKCNVDISAALIKWENNWTTFLDNLLQVKILQMDTRSLYVPVAIGKLAIDPCQHTRYLEKHTTSLFTVNSYKELNLVKCAGVEISGIRAFTISKKKQTASLILEKHEFVPNTVQLDIETSASIVVQTVVENTLISKFKAVEIVDDCTKQDTILLLPLLNKALDSFPTITVDFTVSTKNDSKIELPIKKENFILKHSSSLILIIATKLSQRPTLLAEASDALSDNGFLLSREDMDFVPENTEHLIILTQHILENEKLLLLRKSKRKQKIVSIEVQSNNFEWLSPLQKVLEKDLDIIIHSKNLEPEGTLGLINCLRKEPSGSKIRSFFMMDVAPNFNIDNHFYQEQLKKQMVVNIYKGGKWGTYRHLDLDNLNEIEAKHFFVQNKVKGDLSSLKWVQGSLTVDTKLPEEYTLVYPFYCALNFKDVMIASGRVSIDSVGTERIKQENCLGFEFSGIDVNGHRVMGISTSGAQATIIAANNEHLVEVPDDWSLEDASTVLIVYSTVIYALLKVTNIKEGMSILIHSGTGGVGLAAINTCLHHKLEIYVTVGNVEKRNYIKKRFPQIPDNQIGNSRNESFEEMIKTQTRGRGVDIILNSLSEEKLRASVRCIAERGRFLEIGKYDMEENAALNLLLLERNVNYHGVMLDTIFSESPEVTAWIFNKFKEGMRLGYIKSLPKTVFQYNEIIQAYKYMTTGKHIGKVVIKIRNENDKVFSPAKSLFKGNPRFTCEPQKSYIILGGLGGVGLELADWLYLRGGRKIVLVSRQGIQSGYQKRRMENIRSYGVSIQVSTKNITTRDGCLELIHETTKLGPIDGIFNLAVVLQDALFMNQNKESFITSLAPKAQATLYLDQITREHCPQLRYFVVFSSVSCGRGNAGQTNYGMANSVMERICERRKLDGLPGLAIQWGAIGDVGIVAKMKNDNRDLKISGTIPQRISSCMAVLDQFLNQHNPVVASMIVAERSTRNILNNLVDSIAYILGIKDINSVGVDTTLSELGMDSMMATEAMQILDKDFNINVASKQLRNLTFAKLRELENRKQNTEMIANNISDIFLNYLPVRNSNESPLIKMTSNEKENKNSKTVFLLPGVEGVLKPMNSISEYLDAHVLGVEYANYSNASSIEEYAQILFPHIEEIVIKQGAFFIISYSFGTIIALELASLLEAKGFMGHLLLIEGAPEYISSVIRQSFPFDKENEFQTFVLFKIMSLFIPINTFLKKTDKFLNCKSLEERFELAMSMVPSELTEKSYLKRDAFVSFNSRLKAGIKYEFNHPKIKSQVHLLKSKIPLLSGFIEDYKLSEICKKPVETTVIDGNHFTILQQSQLSDEFNKLLKE